MTAIEMVAWSIAKTLQATLTGRLLQLQLARRYRAFLFFLVVSLLRSLALATYGSESLERYVQVWNWSTAPVLIALTLAVYELHQQVLAHCKPLKFPTAVTVLMFVIALVACLATMESVTWRSSVTASYTATRFVSGSLAIWLLFHAAFFPKIEPPLPSNLMAHGYILTLYLISEAGAYAVINLLAPTAPTLNVATMGINGAFFSAWLIAMRREHPSPVHQPDTQPHDGHED